MILKLAWRNIWRNGRRSALTLSSLGIALCLALLMQSLQQGTYQHILSETVHSYQGHLQIQAHSTYFPQSIVGDLPQSESFKKDVLIPCLTSEAMAFGKQQSYQSVLLQGVEVGANTSLHQVHQHIISGQFFESSSDKNLLIGEQLAKKLQCKVGEGLTLELLTSLGEQVRVVYEIKGIFRLPSRVRNKRVIYLPLNTMQNLLGVPNQVSSYAIILANPAMMEEKKKQLLSKIGTATAKVSTWKETQPELAQVVGAQLLGARLMMGVLYVVVGFGFLTSIILLTHERQNELKMLVWIGMTHLQVAWVLGLEVLFLGSLGMVFGNLTALPLLMYCSQHPISLAGAISGAIQDLGLSPKLYFALDVGTFWLPNLVLLLLIVLLIAYVFQVAFTLKAR